MIDNIDEIFNIKLSQVEREPKIIDKIRNLYVEIAEKTDCKDDDIFHQKNWNDKRIIECFCFFNPNRGTLGINFECCSNKEFNEIDRELKSADAKYLEKLLKELEDYKELFYKYKISKSYSVWEEFKIIEIIM